MSFVPGPLAQSFISFNGVALEWLNDLYHHSIMMIQANHQATGTLQKIYFIHE